MLQIDLVYDHDDAKTDAVRTSLRDSLHMLGLAPRWNELRYDATLLPAGAPGLPRPMVVVDGEPVSAQAPPSRAQIFMKLQDVSSRR